VAASYKKDDALQATDHDKQTTDYRPQTTTVFAVIIAVSELLGRT
jgi:hypothetical protein